MCLSDEWFANSDERKKSRDTNGVTIEEIEHYLKMNFSTVYPVAFEMAEWLMENWTINQIDDLRPDIRKMLIETIEHQKSTFESSA